MPQREKIGCQLKYDMVLSQLIVVFLFLREELLDTGSDTKVTAIGAILARFAHV